jgi:excisionase family DNA binding protein
MERRWITVRETAELLSVHPMSVRKWIDAGKIKAIRLGRSIRVDLRVLEADLERQFQGTIKRAGHK